MKAVAGKANEVTVVAVGVVLVAVTIDDIVAVVVATTLNADDFETAVVCIVAIVVLPVR